MARKLRFRLPRVSRALVLVTTAVVVLLVVVGAAAWTVLHMLHVDIRIPGLAVAVPAKDDRTHVAAKSTNAPAAKPTEPPPKPLPSGAPTVGSDLDPRVAFPFALRLMQVNALAHRPIVTSAEYHDSDAGQRYFVAVVTSCKDLNAIWPIAKGVLEAKVVTPLHLRTDFPIFAFVQHDSEGQWGVVTCDGST